MNALNIFLVILIIGANVGSICSNELENLVPSAPGYIEPSPSPTPTSAPSTLAPPTPILPTPTPISEKCFKNSNGMCKKKIDVNSSLNDSLVDNNILWTSTPIMNCAHRDFEEVKVCSLDCDNIFRIGRCSSTMNPVCGYSIKTNTCRKFANPCLLKQDACRYSTIMDWRVTNLSRCQYLRIGGPAGVCMKINTFQIHNS